MGIETRVSRCLKALRAVVGGWWVVVVVVGVKANANANGRPCSDAVGHLRGASVTHDVEEAHLSGSSTRSSRAYAHVARNFERRVSTTRGTRVHVACVHSGPICTICRLWQHAGRDVF